MLVLTRKTEEKILIGDKIVLTVVSISGNKVRLAIDAPQDVQILRGELALETLRDLNQQRGEA